MRGNHRKRDCARFRLAGITSCLVVLAAAAVSTLGEPVQASVDRDGPPSALAEAVAAALESWSQFAVTGDLGAARSSFVVGAPQWRQFVSEAGSVVDDPQQFILHEVRLRRLGGTTATVWAAVGVTRPGHVAQTFGWDFDLMYQDGRWLVWTVVPEERPTESEVLPPTVPSTTASTLTPTPTEKGPGEVAVDRRVEAMAGPSKPTGTRIPALSAWIVVVTVIGVALAGYMAPRLDRRQE